MKPNKAAQALGRLARGKPKNYSREERERRTRRIVEARRKFLAKRDTACPNCGRNLEECHGNCIFSKPIQLNKREE